MKKMKKLLAFVVAMTMVLAMGITAFADTTNTKKGEGSFSIGITKDATDKAAHTYGAFQVFKGDLAESDGSKVLSNIEWGNNIDTAKTANLITAVNTALGLEGDNALAADATAADVAKAIGDKGLAADSEGAQALADAFNAALTGSAASSVDVAADFTGEAKIENLNAGYYLVKDTADVTGQGAQTRYILQVVSNVSVTEKADVPSVEKKVKETNDTAGTTTDWQDAADYDIGDTIPYQLTGTLPGKFAEYDTYKVYTFTDTLSAGLTPPAADAVTVKVVKTVDETEVETDVTAHFNITVADQVITVSLKEGEDLKAWTEPALDKDSKIVVNYSATLNENAVIGAAGNPNTVKLDYTNNPNGEQDGEKGTTPEDKVIVFTYTIKANKVDGNNKPLEGAGFTLYKKVGKDYVAVGKEITGVTTFEFTGTDAGDYKLVETTVPAGYNKADDIEFTVTAAYDTDSADPKLTSLAVTPENAGFTCTLDSGVVSTDIVNQAGAQLPSTGGIGTTIFYLIGTLLVLGAGIVLVTKKRMSK